MYQGSRSNLVEQRSPAADVEVEAERKVVRAVNRMMLTSQILDVGYTIFRVNVGIRSLLSPVKGD
jgi:hypothetical protein